MCSYRLQTDHGVSNPLYDPVQESDCFNTGHDQYDASWLAMQHNPKGSMYPNSINLSLKVVSILLLWGQSIYYLGTWILWEYAPKHCWARP